MIEKLQDEELLIPISLVHRILAFVEGDECAGESSYARGVNDACARHATGIRNMLEGKIQRWPFKTGSSE
jgi:hypothetical protein